MTLDTTSPELLNLIESWEADPVVELFCQILSSNLMVSWDGFLGMGLFSKETARL